MEVKYTPRCSRPVRPVLSSRIGAPLSFFMNRTCATHSHVILQVFKSFHRQIQPSSSAQNPSLYSDRNLVIVNEVLEPLVRSCLSHCVGDVVVSGDPAD